jgi:hypothetical protein
MAIMGALRLGGAQLQDALLGFTQRDDAQVQAVFVLGVQPVDHVLVWLAPGVFGQNAGVE